MHLNWLQEILSILARILFIGNQLCKRFVLNLGIFVGYLFTDSFGCKIYRLILQSKTKFII